MTTVWVAMAGARRHNKFIIENLKLFKKELENYKKYLLIYIEPLDLIDESSVGYLRLICKSVVDVCKRDKKYKNSKEIKASTKVFDDDSYQYSKLLDTLKLLLDKLIEDGLEIVLFLGEFDELEFANKVFYNNLKSLWARLHPNLHLIFQVRERVTRPENLTSWRDLNEVILLNVVHAPILGGKDIEYMFNRLSNELSIKFTSDEKTLMKRLCGGHPYSLKVAAKVVKNRRADKLNKSDLENVLLNHFELRSIASGVFQIRDNKEKRVLRSIAERGEISASADVEAAVFLEKMGFIKKSPKGAYKLYGTLYKNTVLGHTQSRSLSVSTRAGLEFDDETEAIIHNGKTIEEKFTRQEYSVLSMFLKNDHKILNRDDIGEVLWGKESYEKYSDWAIDQLMSKLRKKLLSLRIRNKLVTIRGKGYKLIQPVH